MPIVTTLSATSETLQYKDKEEDNANKHQTDCGLSKLPRLALIRSRVGPFQALISRGTRDD